MIRIYLISVILLLPALTFGQKQFKIKSATGRSVTIKINSDTISFDSTYVTINTNYPAFDTFSFLAGGPNGPFPSICNFKADSAYSVIYACCGSLDIVPSWKMNVLKKNDWDYVDNEYQEMLMDRPKFTLKVTNAKSQDSIYGWYSDAACFPVFKLLSEKGWYYGSAIKCYYWNNFSDFVFFTSDGNYSNDLNENCEIEDVYAYPNESEEDNIQNLGRICVRLFDNDRYIITYDAESGEVKLEEDER